jgi:hypothetical protein
MGDEMLRINTINFIYHIENIEAYQTVQHDTCQMFCIEAWCIVSNCNHSLVNTFQPAVL